MRNLFASCRKETSLDPQAAVDISVMKVAIIGGSLGGLASANAFHRLGASVTVFEKHPRSFEQRGAGMGFVDVALWEQLRGGRFMRRGRRASRSQGGFFYGDLWQFLYDGLPHDCVKFDAAVQDLGMDNMHPTIDGEVFDLAIVADGGWSNLRHYVTGDKEPEYSGYVIWRGRVDLEDLQGYQEYGIWKNGIYDTIVLPIPTSGGLDYVIGGTFVATPEDEIVQPERGANRHIETSKLYQGSGDVDWFLRFHRQKFGDQAGGEVTRFFEVAASKGKVTCGPLYEFVADRAVAGRIVIVGDAAHMASPRTASGAHTAIQDAMHLFETFARVGLHDIDSALKDYNREAVLRAKQLYMRSRECSLEFLPVGGKSAVISPTLVVP